MIQDHILIELCTYIPTIRFNISKKCRLMVEEILGNSGIMFFEYNNLNSNANKEDIHEMAVKENRTDIVYSLVDHFSVINVAYWAAKYKRKTILDEMIRMGVENYSMVARGAAEGGNVDLFFDIISKNPNITFFPHDGIADAAAKGGNLNIISYLKDKGIIKDSHIAFNIGASNHMYIVEAILKDDDIRCEIAAGSAFSGNTELMERMVAEYGGDKNTLFLRIVYSAVRGGHSDIVTRYLAKMDCEIPFSNIASYAVLGGHKSIVEYVIDLSDNVLSYIKGLTEIAARCGYQDIFEFLLDEQRGVNGVIDSHTLHHYSWEAAVTRRLNIIRKIVDEYPSHNDNYREITLLAASAGAINIVRYMLSLGIDCYNDIAAEGARNGHSDIVKTMLDLGADDIREIVYNADEGESPHIIIAIKKRLSSELDKYSFLHDYDSDGEWIE